MSAARHEPLATVREHASGAARCGRTEPRNDGKPYASATVVRRIVSVKQFFKFAVELGILAASPAVHLQGGDSVNPSRWRYVSVEDCVRGIQTEPNLKTRVTVALLRFCGLRGTSDIIKLTWADIAWGHEKTPVKQCILQETKKGLQVNANPEMENSGFEPLTYWLPASRSAN